MRAAQPVAADGAEEALAFYQRALQAQAAGNPDEAIHCLDAALRQRPNFPEALCLGAYLLQSCGQAAGALRLYDRALALRPGDATAWFNRGGLLLAVGKREDALRSFESACALRPDEAAYHCNRGAALFELGRLAEAAEAAVKALTLDPTLPKAALNLGNALMRQGRYEEAREAYARAVALQPHYALAHCGAGIVAKELGLFEEAMRAFDRALALDPESEEALSNKGCLQLLLGDFASGWEGYEHRWSRGQRPVPMSEARFDLTSRDGLTGRKILIVNDHGLGDTIQFFRYVVALARAGALVTFAGPRKLHRLLASSGVAIDWRAETDLDGRFEAVLAISSLPRACGTRLDTIPAATPYLYAEPEKSAAWRHRLAGPGLKIGLCWSGNVDFRVDPRRSIPPQALMPLASHASVRLFSLQKGVAASELPSSLAERLENRGQEIDSGPDAFLDTAALMANLDLIITCDTSIAHLAGALGRPVWVALRHIAEWRWLVGREDAPWYPSMRLFRCGEGDHWEALFRQMALEVSKVQACG